MRMKLIYAVLAAMLFAVASIAAWPQGLTTVNGTVKDGNTPLAGVQVVLTFKDSGKTFKAKTDKNGTFTAVGLPLGIYTVDVFSATGKNENIFEKDYQFRGENGAPDKVDIDVAGASTKKMTKEELEKAKAENAKAVGINELIAKYNAASAAQNWQEAEPILKQMVAADPNNWRFYSALGGAQVSQGEFEDAVASFDKGIQVAQQVVSGAIPKDPHNPDIDPVKAKTGMGQMYAAQGNAYLKLKKNPEAVAAFTKAAEMDPNPATAYFNLCATQYNTGNTDGALAACDKAIAADPTKADAYFIKGSLMVGQGTQDKEGKYVVPPGTAEALNKYLELSPDGPHAADVKQMLSAIGAKIETTYKSKKK